MAEEFRGRRQGDYDRNQSYQKRPRFEGDDRRQGRFGPSRGNDGPALDEDLQFCPSFENWKNRSAENTSVDKYCEFVKQWIADRDSAFAKRHWREDWFMERYDPLRADERAKERVESARKRASELVPALFVSLKQSPQEPNKVILGPEPFELSEAICAYIPHVPPHLPRVVLEKALQAEGAQVVLLSEVNRAKKRKDLGRRGTVLFKEAQLARDCITKNYVSCWVAVDADGVNAESSSVKDEQRIELTVKALPFKILPNRVVPHEASSEERTQKDDRQALACAEALDQAFGIASEVSVSAAIAKRPESVSKLDAVIQYLRYVHLYCYYSGSLCRDYGELVHKSASPFVRAEGAAHKGEAESGHGGEADDAPQLSSSAGQRDGPETIDARRFFETVDYTAEKIIKEFTGMLEAERSVMENALLRRNQLAEEALEKFVSENIAMKNTHVYCATHDKLFQNETFFRKHLINFHGASIRSAQRKALMDLFFEVYRRDEDKPVPRPQRFVDDVLQGKFVPFEHTRPPQEVPRRQEYPRSSGGGTGGWHRQESGGSASSFAAPPIQGNEAVARRYRDPDAPQAEAAPAPKPQKLQYRTRVSYAG